MGYHPTHGKFNKYAQALDGTDLYNFPKDGYDWCLVQEFGVEVAKAMTGQPTRGCGAGCDFSASYYRARNQWSADPSLDAQVFFGSRGDEYHTGMVVGYDSAHVFTVEGTRATAPATRAARYSSAPTRAAICVSVILAFGVFACVGHLITKMDAKEQEAVAVEQAHEELVRHDSLAPTYTYDGEVIRWYVLVDPDCGIQYLVNDRGGCCVRLDSYGNVMGVSYE